MSDSKSLERFSSFRKEEEDKVAIFQRLENNYFSIRAIGKTFNEMDRQERDLAYKGLRESEELVASLPLGDDFTWNTKVFRLVSDLLQVSESTMMSSFAMSGYLERKSDKIIASLDQCSTDLQILFYLQLLVLVHRYGDEEKEREALAVLSARYGHVLELFEKGDFVDECIPILRTILEYGQQRQRKEVFRALSRTVFSTAPGKKEIGMKIVAKLVGGYEQTRHAFPLIRELLSRYGIEAENVVDEWNMCDSQELDELVIRENLQCIDKLSQKDPEMVPTLHKRMLIRSFSSYPQSLLEQNYEQLDNKEIPYGIMISATWDHNYNFKSDAGWLQQLSKTLGPQFVLRVFDCESIDELLRIGVMLKVRYPGNLPQFVIFRTHADIQSLTLSSKRHGSLKADIFTDGRMKRFSDDLAPHAPIISLGCNNAVEKGFLHVGSHIFRGHKFSGYHSLAKKPRLVPTRHEGWTDLDVTFDGVPATSFLNGAKIKRI